MSTHNIWFGWEIISPQTRDIDVDVKSRIGMTLPRIRFFRGLFRISDVFNVPPTANVIWRWGQDLEAHLIDWASQDQTLHRWVQGNFRLFLFPNENICYGCSLEVSFTIIMTHLRQMEFPTPIGSVHFSFKDFHFYSNFVRTFCKPDQMLHSQLLMIWSGSALFASVPQKDALRLTFCIWWPNCLPHVVVCF